MESLKDYARRNGVSYETIRKQILNYSDELSSHIIKRGKTRYLDEEGAVIFDTIREQAHNPHNKSIIENDADRETIMRLQAMIMARDEQIMKLQAMQIEAYQGGLNPVLLEQANERAEAAEAEVEKLRQEIREKDAREGKIKEKEKEIEQALEDARQAREQAKQELTEYIAEKEAERQERARERAERETERARVEQERQEKDQMILKQAEEIAQIRQELEDSREEAERAKEKAGGFFKNVFRHFRNGNG